VSKGVITKLVQQQLGHSRSRTKLDNFLPGARGVIPATLAAISERRSATKRRPLPGPPLRRVRIGSMWPRSVGQAVEAVPCVSRIVSRYGTDGTRLVVVEVEPEGRAVALWVTVWAQAVEKSNFTLPYVQNVPVIKS
jgi:hypothetical protein